MIQTLDFRRACFWCCSIVLWTFVISVRAQQQDPTTMNGGSLLAMAGKNCVAVAVDKRFGSGPQMVNIAPRHVWTPHAQAMVAFVGLEGDVQSLSQELQSQVVSRLYRSIGFRLADLSPEEEVSPGISPRALASLTSHILYRRRGGYYVEPLVVGLQPHTLRPFLCAMDMIGAQSFSKSFVVSGAASTSLYGTAEAMWKPQLEPEELMEVCGKAFQSALERDCLSGYGAVVYLLTEEGIIEYDLASRND